MPKNFGEELYNQISFAYLSQLKRFAAEMINEESPLTDGSIKKGDELYKILNLIVNLPDEYNDNDDFSELYKKYIDSMNQFALQIYDVYEQRGEELSPEQRQAYGPMKVGYSNEQRTAFDNLVFHSYHNDNKALELVSTMVNDVTSSSNITRDTEKAITQRLESGTKTKWGKTTPQSEGSGWGLLLSNFILNFTPMATTSFPTVRHYDYQGENPHHTEVRFGTQGAFVWGQGLHINPLFEAYLKASANRRQLQPPSIDAYQLIDDYQPEVGANNESLEKTAPRQPPPIQHVYINHLASGKKRKLPHATNREKDITVQLHDLEQTHLNIAVITLPADGGLLKKEILNTDKKISQAHARAVFHNLLTRRTDLHDPKISSSSLADIEGLKESNPDLVKDDINQFLMSDTIRAALFVNENNQSDIINQLIEVTLTKLNLSDKDPLTYQEMQAAYFHLVKFELTNYILETLNPESFNITCKDAIDRAGVSSAYYNLMKSIEEGQPLSRDEFERGLNAAPTMVKGRGINHHSQRIWNAVDAYIEANAHEAPQWLKDWRDDNVPDYRAKDLFFRTYAQNIGQLETLRQDIGPPNEKEKVEVVEKAIELLNTVAELKESNNKSHWPLYQAAIYAASAASSVLNDDNFTQKIKRIKNENANVHQKVTHKELKAKTQKKLSGLNARMEKTARHQNIAHHVKTALDEFTRSAETLSDKAEQTQATKKKNKQYKETMRSSLELSQEKQEQEESSVNFFRLSNS